MSNSNMRHVDTTANTVIFADPSDFRRTFKVTVDRKPKAIGAARLTNVRTEVKSNSPAAVIGSEPCIIGNEIIAVTTTVSGSLENRAQVEKEVDLHIARLNQFKADLCSGWKPDGASIIPAVLTEE